MLNWLNGPQPHLELARLRASGALALELPEVDCLYGVPQNPEHHPEVDTGVHIEMCLEVAARLDASPAARFAVLTHDLGKGLTPAEQWPRHIDHETRGLQPLAALCDRLAVPAAWRRLAQLVCELHLNAHRAFEMRPRSVVEMLHGRGLETDAQMLEDFVVACECDKRGRLGMQQSDYPQGAFLRRARQALLVVPAIAGVDPQTRQGQERHQARLEAVQSVRRDFDSVRASPADGSLPRRA
jgi:tRNA nucleotidyltransferase (CCA-adding enzyme)